MHHRVDGAHSPDPIHSRGALARRLARAVTVLALSAPLAIAFGCSGGGGGSGAGGGGGSTSEGGSTGTGLVQPIDWSGTWSVKLSYHVDCDYSLGNVKSADNSQTNSVDLMTSGGSGVNADIMGYQMSGTGNKSGLSLSGQFPVMDEGQSVAGDVQADNNITLDITTVTDDNHANGTISGVFQGQFGATCTISKGTAAFSR